MDGGAWWAAVYGVTQSRIQLKLLSSMAWQSLSPFSSLAISSLILTLEWIVLKGIPSQGLNDLLNFFFLNFLSHTKMSFMMLGPQQLMYIVLCIHIGCSLTFFVNRSRK